jgi:hypothetical protein
MEVGFGAVVCNEKGTKLGIIWAKPRLTHLLLQARPYMHIGPVYRMEKGGSQHLPTAISINISVIPDYHSLRSLRLDELSVPA